MKYIVNDPSFDLVSDQHTAAQWVLSAATGIERLAGGMSLAYIARLRDAWAEIERLRAELAKRPKLWIVTTPYRMSTAPELCVDVGDCGDPVPCIAAFDRKTDADYVAACIGGTVEEWGVK